MHYILDVAKVFAFCNSVRGDDDGVNGFADSAFAAEYLGSVEDAFTFGLVEGIRLVAVFHLAQVHDSVRPVDQHVNLHACCETLRQMCLNRCDLAKSLSIRTALVYDGALAPSVEADRYFDFILSFDKLLRE